MDTNATPHRRDRCSLPRTGLLCEEFGGGRDDGGRQGDLAQGQHLGSGALAGLDSSGRWGMRAVRPRWPGREALLLVTG
ncbi:hypothetical protein [Kitasatospora herbaricolor]|uniref:hypothetical protein n=1 Tax=Kitasatospora herbaricolor TaxID=68217 RepID=UPI0036DD9D35